MMLLNQVKLNSILGNRLFLKRNKKINFKCLKIDLRISSEKLMSHDSDLKSKFIFFEWLNIFDITKRTIIGFEFQSSDKCFT
jgi:hypothetical protein